MKPRGPSLALDGELLLLEERPTALGAGKDPADEQHCSNAGDIEEQPFCCPSTSPVIADPRNSCHGCDKIEDYVELTKDRVPEISVHREKTSEDKGRSGGKRRDHMIRRKSASPAKSAHRHEKHGCVEKDRYRDCAEDQALPAYRVQLPLLNSASPFPLFSQNDSRLKTKKNA